MAGATSHKLGVDLTIIWVGDVGGKREGRGKRVGCSYPDLTDQPSPDINPRLVTPKWRGLSSSAVCGCSHRWKNTPKLSEKPGGQAETAPQSRSAHAWAIITVSVLFPPLPATSPLSPLQTQQGMSTPPNTRPLRNACLSSACGIKTENQRPTTVVHSTYTHYLWGWKQLFLRVVMELIIIIIIMEDHRCHVNDYKSTQILKFYYLLRY